MRRTILKLSTLFLFCACAMVEEKEPAALPHNVITAQIAETPATKTHLSPDNDSNIRKVLWSKGDRILLSGPYDKIYYTEDDASSFAAFFPEDGIDFMDLSTGVIAVYPAEDVYMSGPDAEKEIYLTLSS